MSTSSKVNNFIMYNNLFVVCPWKQFPSYCQNIRKWNHAKEACLSFQSNNQVIFEQFCCFSRNWRAWYLTTFYEGHDILTKVILNSQTSIQWKTGLLNCFPYWFHMSCYINHLNAEMMYTSIFFLVDKYQLYLRGGLTSFVIFFLAPRRIRYSCMQLNVAQFIYLWQ